MKKLTDLREGREVFAASMNIGGSHPDLVLSQTIRVLVRFVQTFCPVERTRFDFEFVEVG